MLKFYLSTVIMYMIVIYCTIQMFKETLKKRLGVNENRKVGLFTKLSTLFILSAVPILRFIIVCVLIYIGLCKQKDFDELMKRAENKDSE